MKKILLLTVCFLLIGCSSNKELEDITEESFTNAFSNKNFEVANTLDKYSTIDYIIDAYTATYNDDIVVEFIKYNNEENAEKVLEGNIKSFNLLKSTGANEKNEKGKNYHKYLLISNNYYMTSNRINNTLIFTKTKLTNKDTVESILKDLGL